MTEHTTISVDDFSDREYDTLERTRWGCVCGTVDTSEPDATLRHVEPHAAIADLFNCLMRMHRSGAIEHRPDREKFLDAIRDQGIDFEYAAGKSLAGES